MEERSAKRENFIKYVSNPRSYTLKKWFMEMLKEEYPQHDVIVERVAAVLLTDSDVSQFGKLISNVYEKAYRKAIDDYKDQAEKLGIKVNINHKPSGQEE